MAHIIIPYFQEENKSRSSIWHALIVNMRYKMR